MIRRVARRLRRMVLIAYYGVGHRRDLSRWRARAWATVDDLGRDVRSVGRRELVLVGLHQHLGDIVMATAVIRQLRARHPDAAMVFATQARYREIAANDPNVDHIVDCSCVGSLLALATHPAFHRAYLLVLAGDRCELCGAVVHETYRPFVDARIDYSNWFRSGRHLVDLWCERLGLDPADTAPRLTIPDAIREHAHQRLAARLRMDRRPIVALHTQTPHWTAKQWPTPRFFELMDRLQSQLGAQVVVVGAEPVPALPKGVSDLTGQTDLLELAAILSEADLFIGLDSGPAHLASAVGVPSVVLFGPTDPAACRPRGPAVTTIWHGAELDGLFAGGVKSGTLVNRDIAKITVDEVMGAASRNLTASAEPASAGSR